MAVWAIAWAGSKPVASLLDGLLAGHVGLQRTGILLAAPALVPVSVMVALMVPVLVLRKWQRPTGSWLASGRDKMESLELFQCAGATLLHASGKTSAETASRH